MLATFEANQRLICNSTETAKKTHLGQFFTPAHIADFMASLFSDRGGDCRLLDAGAGIGSLTAAFVERWVAGHLHFNSVEAVAFEIDTTLHSHLRDALAPYATRDHFSLRIVGDDFILSSAHTLSQDLFAKPLTAYTHAILNPPYRKLNSNSTYWLALRRIGIETVNLYSAFVALALAQLAPAGQLVAIIPRSFCNGPYYRSFRNLVLKHAAIRHIHLFESRSKAFKDDDVLQENVIILLERGSKQGNVTISTSTDDTFSDLAACAYPFEQIVLPDDAEHFIHIPTSSAPNRIELWPAFGYTLADLGIQVSTGPVVDFRLKDHLREMPGPGTVPLLYPAHFSGQKLRWPIEGMKRPNAIERNKDTEKWLYSNGFYCVARRFSSKEERRRIVASVVDPTVFGDAPMLGFENHLNVFHDARRGLPEPLARGLAVFLNTTAVDQCFRRFNGHTQVNATDLRLMKYPSRADLIALGCWAMQQETLTQGQIDAKLEALLR